MGFDDHNYHRDRERHCRTMANLASDPEVRRRHQELADLHAGRAVMADLVLKAMSERSVRA
jgi:hypothetical protein